MSITYIMYLGFIFVVKFTKIFFPTITITDFPVFPLKSYSTATRTIQVSISILIH